MLSFYAVIIHTFIAGEYTGAVRAIPPERAL